MTDVKKGNCSVVATPSEGVKGLGGWSDRLVTPSTSTCEKSPRQQDYQLAVDSTSDSCRGGAGGGGGGDPHVQFFKTRLCPFREEGCRRGDNCTYAHTEQELRPSLNLTKTKLCYAYIRGKCQLGADVCRYAHGHNNLRSTPQFYKTQICKFWSMDVQCPGGKYCRHAHGGDDLRVVSETSNHSSSQSETPDNKAPDLCLFTDCGVNQVLNSNSCTENIDFFRDDHGHWGNSSQLPEMKHNLGRITTISNSTTLGHINTISNSTTMSMPGISQSSLQVGLVPKDHGLRTVSSGVQPNGAGGIDPAVDKSSRHGDAHRQSNMSLGYASADTSRYYNGPSGVGNSSDALTALLNFLESRGLSIWAALYILKGMEQQHPSCYQFDDRNGRGGNSRPSSNYDPNVLNGFIPYDTEGLAHNVAFQNGEGRTTSVCMYEDRQLHRGHTRYKTPVGQIINDVEGYCHGDM